MVLLSTILWACTIWANNVSPNARAIAPELSPIWEWRTSAAMEWTTVVGSDAATGLLVATRDGHLHLLDTTRGTSQWRSLRVPAGVRPALHGRPTHREFTFAFDAATIYALNLKAPDAVRWRFGGDSADPQSYPSDPEFLAQWIAVAAGREAVLAVGTDGRMICLSPTDGKLRWMLELEPLSLARLRVSGKHAAVVWKAAGRVRAMCVPTTEVKPSPSVADLGDAWPVWTEWTPAGLVCVAGGRVTVVPPSGPPRTFDTGLRWVSGSTIGAFPAAVSPSAAKSTLLLIGHGPHVSAYDLATGDRAWASWKLSDSKKPGGNISQLDVIDGSVLCIAVDEVIVRDARSGSLQAALRLPGPILSAHWDKRRLHVLCASEEDAHTLTLTRRNGISASWSIRRPAGMRGTPQVVWIADGFVLVEAGEIRAYRLP